MRTHDQPEGLGQPTDGEKELYLCGSCHVFAAALHRAFGWPFLVMTDPDLAWWTDPTDADNFIPAVVHVYALDPNGEAWDILGHRPAGSVVAELSARHPDVERFDEDVVCQLTELGMYVDGLGGEDIDRPLHRIEHSDVDTALETALRLYSDLFPAISPAMTSP